MMTDITEIISCKHFFKRMFIMILLLSVVSITYAQERLTQGVIIDESGIPIPGANILIKGTSNGTVSDSDGKFTVKIPSDNTTLVISFVGYEMQEVQVGNTAAITVVLKELRSEIDNVIVIGYGTQKKSDLTGAIVSVSGEQLSKTPSSGALQALEGKAAGVQIINSSGMPGAPIYVRVRGINTITKQSQYGGVAGPVYIIDGIQGDINTINPNDIDHIEILKDASAQAIYGSSGGNGVIIVTTKLGKKNQKTKVDFSMYRGIQTNDISVDMCNTEEFIKIYNSLDATKPINRITANPDSLPNTNWWNEISSNAVMEEYNLSVSGGSENSASYLSLGYFNQDGVVDKTNYKRYTIKVNNSFDINKRIRIGENISLTATRNQGNDGWGTPMGSINQSPISYVRDTSSTLTPEQMKTRNIGWGGWAQPMFNTGNGNPVAGIYYYNAKKGTYAMNGNLFANVEIIKGLTYTNNFGFGVNFYEMDDFKPYYFINTTQNNKVIQVSRQLDRTFKWNWQHVLDYKMTLNNQHSIDVMAGFEASEWFYKGLSGQADSLLTNGATPEYQYIDATLRDYGSEYSYAGGGMGHGSKYAYFGRLNYEYKNLFLAQFTYRYEGSTNFGKDHRFGGFPGFSAGFKFSELNAVKENIPYLSFGKLRFGWGHTGNDQIPGDKFSSLAGVSAGYGYPLGGSGTAGGVSLAPGNSKLHWEDIITYNYGLDMNFFENKLTFTAEYFSKNTTGMLHAVTMPLGAGSYGFDGDDGKFMDNLGSLSNKGLELVIGYKDKVGDLKYGIDFNFSKITSKLYDLNDTITLPETESNPKSIVLNGHAPGVFWGYKTDGLFRPEDVETITENGKTRNVWKDLPYKLDSQGRRVYAQNKAKTGDLRFIDMNGDTLLTEKDKVITGNPNPKFTFGLTINLEYKGFDLNCFIMGSYGNDIFNASKTSWYNSNGLNNWTKDALKAYRDPVYDANGNMIDPGNTSASQFALRGSTTDNYRMSDWYVEDGSYVKLKSIKLGYTIPKSLTAKIGIERFRVYVGARNLITLTKYSGLDPELGGTNDPLQFGVDNGSYPMPKMYNIGFDVSF